MVVAWWWCFCGGGVAVFLWWCFSGGGVVVFLWWWWRGGVFVVVVACVVCGGVFVGAFFFVVQFCFQYFQRGNKEILPLLPEVLLAQLVEPQSCKA